MHLLLQKRTSRTPYHSTWKIGMLNFGQPDWSAKLQFISHNLLVLPRNILLERKQKCFLTKPENNLEFQGDLEIKTCMIPDNRADVDDNQSIHHVVTAKTRIVEAAEK